MKSNLNLIVIDSNFILLPFQFKVDYLSQIRHILEGELEFVIFRQILNELESKKKREPQATKFNRLLNAGLLYLDEHKKDYDINFLNEVKNNDETTDDFLLRKIISLKTKANNVFLATNDSDLRKRAKEQYINTIFLRQKKFLSIERI
ncbi:MAG: PIN domain-containing protein [Promethearchaeota archaeon]